MQCNAMQCNAMQCNAMQCNAMLRSDRSRWYANFLAVKSEQKTLNVQRCLWLSRFTASQW